jgi:transposase
MILDKFLNLKGTSIQGYRHLENIGIVWRIESKNQKATCPRCGLESDKLHQNHRYLVKDLPISGQPVYLYKLIVVNLSAIIVENPWAKS